MEKVRRVSDEACSEIDDLAAGNSFRTYILFTEKIVCDRVLGVERQQGFWFGNVYGFGEKPFCLPFVPAVTDLNLKMMFTIQHQPEWINLSCS